MNNDADFLYKVVYLHQDKVQEVMVKQIFTSDLYGFIEIEDFVLGDDKALIVDPGKEKIVKEFAQVKRSYIPMQHILRIDEIAHSKESDHKADPEQGTTRQMLFQLPSTHSPHPKA